MMKHEAEILATGFRQLIEGMLETSERKGDDTVGRNGHNKLVRVPSTGMTLADIRPATPEEQAGVRAKLDAAQVEALYIQFKHRLIDDLRSDPVFVKLLAAQPEIVVEFEPRIVTLDATTMKGRLARLIADGWFATPRATGAARKEMARTGADPGGGGGLSDALSAFVKDGFLTRDGGDYVVAPGIKITQRDLSAR